MTVWADANQHVLRSRSSSAPRARRRGAIYAELQRAPSEALRTHRRRAPLAVACQNGAKDPVQLPYQSDRESVDHAQKAFKILEAGAQP